MASLPVLSLLNQHGLRACVTLNFRSPEWPLMRSAQCWFHRQTGWLGSVR